MHDVSGQGPVAVLLRTQRHHPLQRHLLRGGVWGGGGWLGPRDVHYPWHYRLPLQHVRHAHFPARSVTFFPWYPINILGYNFCWFLRFFCFAENTLWVYNSFLFAGWCLVVGTCITAVLDVFCVWTGCEPVMKWLFSQNCVLCGFSRRLGNPRLFLQISSLLIKGNHHYLLFLLIQQNQTLRAETQNCIHAHRQNPIYRRAHAQTRTQTHTKKECEGWMHYD